MCVLAVAWNAHPRWRLVLAGNRDEYHSRPASPLARWDDLPEVIAGRDLQSGGTWLGVSERGRCAVVTNLRGFGMPEPGRPSRGALVTDLLGGADPETVAIDAYNPVNLIAFGRDRGYFLSNRPEPLRTALAPGLYGLSNGRLDEPWPKTMRLKSALLDWLTGPADEPERLFEALREETLPAIGLDPSVQSDIPREPNHSPIFILDPIYGTRCSSIVAVDREGQGLFVERSFAADGTRSGEARLTFGWSVP